MPRNSRTIALVVPMLLIVVLTLAAAPDAPKVSTFAPAKETVAQADKFVAELDAAVASESEYKEAAEDGKIAQDANTLVVIAQALGLHDEDNKYKDAAPAMVQAAQKLAAAKDFESAKSAVAAIKAAAAGEQKATGALKWERLASLEQLMKKVPNINAALKKNVKRAKNAADAEGRAAVLAVIAQAAMANVAETKSPDKADQWYQFCAEMRDAAAAVNKAVHTSDSDATAAAMDKLQQSCEDCHKVFKPE
jgi:hypothetical protein